MWVETVTGGGRRFVAAWRKEMVDAARHRQEKREATRLGKLSPHTNRRTCEATPMAESTSQSNPTRYGRETNRDLSSA